MATGKDLGKRWSEVSKNHLASMILRVWVKSAAVAQVCVVNGLAFIIFRSASDLAGGSGSETAREEMGQFFEIAADNSSTLVKMILRSL